MIKGNHLYRISLGVAGANKIEILMFRDLKKQQEEKNNQEENRLSVRELANLHYEKKIKEALEEN